MNDHSFEELNKQIKENGKSTYTCPFCGKNIYTSGPMRFEEHGGHTHCYELKRCPACKTYHVEESVKEYVVKLVRPVENNEVFIP